MLNHQGSQQCQTITAHSSALTTGPMMRSIDTIFAFKEQIWLSAKKAPLP
jgi:hypothetical protein